ncbi:MAG: AMP-binding protein, partial [Rhodospirillales bacterium]|nr:AMP-binding protein [Rhodospirillales bacterium]
LNMQGYWNAPDLSAEALKDGWVHTGDIGEFDADGYIKITDRKKDIIVNSGGDNLSPQRVEGIMILEPEIAQAMVYGDSKPHLVSLIVPDQEFTKEWAEESGKANNLPDLIENNDFRSAVSAALDRVNEHLSVIERVRRFILVAEEFSVENEMMTPTLKVRRHKIIEVYGDQLEALYRS